MKLRIVGEGILMGFLTGIVVLVISFLINLVTGLVFPPFSLLDFLTRVTPGAVLTFGIDMMVGLISRFQLGSTSDIAKLGEQTMALLIFLLIGGIFGAFLGILATRRDRRLLSLIGMLTGFGLSILFFLIELNLKATRILWIPTLIWLLVIFGLWGWTLGFLIRGVIPVQSEVQNEVQKVGLSRREALYVGGTTLAAIFAGAIGLGYFFISRKTDEESSPKTPPTPISEADLRDRIEPAPGIRSEITPNSEFYRIDINAIPPDIDGESWQLRLSGLVENTMTLSLDDIHSRPSLSQYITLSCISNRVGGDLISTSYWTGISLLELLEEAVLQPEARELLIHSEDGFYESVSMKDMLDPRTLLVYEMNGEPLPVKHGFPLRIYIPGHYGMKQPKWITSMEVVDYEGAGYWVDRGWSKEAIVRTTSVIDNVEVQQDDQTIAISGGIAFAGDRTINAVEVRIDGGNWEVAELRSPPLGPLTWIQWRYRVERLQPGDHTAEVRAYDGNDELQIKEDHAPHPDGATGIFQYEFTV